MFIVSKDKNSIVNAEQITAIFVGADNCSVKADFQNGKSCQLGRYNSEAAAKTALEMVAYAVGKSEVRFMPDDDTVKAKINLEEQKQQHISGKKTKGHGGS